MNRMKYFALCVLFATGAAAARDAEDCELHAPSTMHEFCCSIHDEFNEFVECQIEWADKIHATNEELEMEYIFCVSECTYKKTEYLGADQMSLNMKVIKHHLDEIHGDAESEALMYKTYEMCDKHARDMLSHDEVKKLETRLAAHNCHPYPGLVFECVSNEMIMNCPPKKYHHTAQCDHAKEYLEDCLHHKKKQ